MRTPPPCRVASPVKCCATPVSANRPSSAARSPPDNERAGGWVGSSRAEPSIVLPRNGFAATVCGGLNPDMSFPPVRSGSRVSARWPRKAVHKVVDAGHGGLIHIGQVRRQEHVGGMTNARHRPHGDRKSVV